jgi:acetolactate synthase-1/2/3 large subunit
MLAEKLSLPVAATPNGKGLMQDDHPLYIGVVGRYACPCANQLVSEADLVLYIGCNTGDMATNGWSVPKAKTAVIQIDINPAELGRNYPNLESLLGDADKTVTRLLESISLTRSETPWAEHAKRLRSSWLKEIEANRRSEAVPIQPERLCEELTQVLPHNAVLVADTGNSAIWTSTMVFLTHPQQRYLRCSGSLGWGFPASLGVKCALPDQPVVCFTGDGGFWYHMAELETACRFNIPTVTVVNNNSGLGQCKRPVNRLYAEKGGKSEDMWAFNPVDFAEIANAMGGYGIRVEQPGKIFDALTAALASKRPAVVDVVTDINRESEDNWGGEQPVAIGSSV